jgi:hypothetical protein
MGFNFRLWLFSISQALITKLWALQIISLVTQFTI